LQDDEVMLEIKLDDDDELKDVEELDDNVLSFRFTSISAIFKSAFSNCSSFFFSLRASLFFL